MPGKGSFAAANAGAGAQRKKELEAQLRETVRELRYLGVGREELEALMKEEYHD